MKVNRILFDKLRQEYELLKMRGAYILAEQQILDEGENGTAAGIQPMVADPETYWAMEMDQFGNMKQVTGKELKIRELEKQLEDLKQLGRNLLKQEKYEEMREAKELHDVLEREIIRRKLDL